MKQNIDYEKKLKECVKCKKFLSFSSFNKLSIVASGLNSRCVDCSREYSRNKFREYYSNDEIRKRMGIIRREWNKNNIDKVRATRRKNREKRRLEVLNAYSNNELKCKCCGEKTIEFLSLDHVNNDGYLERKNGKRSSTAIYSKLRSANFPDKHRYQVLCHNCNLAKGFYGKCPHNK